MRPQEVPGPAKPYGLVGFSPGSGGVGPSKPSIAPQKALQENPSLHFAPVCGGEVLIAFIPQSERFTPEALDKIIILNLNYGITV